MEFIKGADVSSLQAMEDYGAKFYDLNGNEADALAILQGHGVNYIRLRLFHQPTRSFDGGDYCDLPHTVLMAKRTKARGLGFLLDFHYSDFWADWKAQTIPVQWQGMSADELEHQVYAYTCEVLQTLTDAGAAPDMVQIGNEIGKGMLWEYGSLKHPRQLAIFLNAGLSAVRAVCEKNRLQMRTVLHVECGADMPRTEQFFTELFANGLHTFDEIGLSYYPFWAGSYEQLRINMENIEHKFHKPVIVMETAFPYTDASHDEMPNIVTGQLTMEKMGLPPSVENQKAVLARVLCEVKAAQNGSGIFYWEPVWYCKKGVGVEKGQGNEWENQALFDEHGKVLSSICAFEECV